MSTLPKRLLVCLWVVFVQLAVSVGCGRKAESALAVQPVVAPVLELADAAERPATFRRLFASGAAPDDKQRKRFADLMFTVRDIKSSSQTEAVLAVLVRDGSGQTIGQSDWTVVNQGNGWKLKSA